ncbi:MAG TPA: sulfatase-like hydrolase/transferase [Thermoleophilaceae bacterium]|nr:sulfatase-like hydrolase/transferase [Thermoleophilaceae bacterium]
MTSPAGGKAEERAGERSERRWALRNGLHLWVLWGFAVAQPTFEFLSGSVSRFFLLRGVAPLSLTVALVGYLVLPPLLMLGAEALVRRFSERWSRRLHLVLVWALVSLIALYFLEQIFPGGDRARGAMLVLGCWAIGLAGTVAYARYSAPRQFLDVLTPAPAIFLVLLLFFSPAKSLVLPGDAGEPRPDSGARAPIVMVVFDEFPTSSLLQTPDRIHAQRFPNFSRLSRETTWFSNATSISASTIESIPSILSGRRPREEDPESEQLPTAADYPDSMFTLLARSHRLEAMELFTQLCRPDLCPLDQSMVRRTLSLASAISVGSAHVLTPPALGIRLPALGSTWGESLNAQDATREIDPSDIKRGEARRYPTAHFEKFIGSLKRQQPGDRPPFHFLHVYVPHTPWRYLPSGQSYTVDTQVRGRPAGFAWSDDKQTVAQALQRHLVQVQATDRLVGRLVRRLREVGLYDKSTLILTADHGGSITPGGNHRKPKKQNLADIGLVPLFVKAPGQTSGGSDQRFVRTLDLLPSVADMLDIKIPWKVAGKSWLPRDNGERPLSMTRYSGKVTPSLLRQQRRRTLRRNIELLGRGGTGPDLFTVGSRPELLGRRLAGLNVAKESGAHAQLTDADRLASVNPRGSFLPALIQGRVVGGRPGRHELAIAINGRIRAAARTSADGQGFSALVPPRAFVKGANRVEIVRVVPTGRDLRLTNLGGVGTDRRTD